MNQFKSSIRASFLLAALGVASGCATSHGTSGSTAEQDAKITADVENAIAAHPDLGPPNLIYVSTKNQVVYLSGTVDTGLAIANAKDVAGQVKGVTRIVSDISVSR
jgi:osmotically-inducible protein OsmY